MKIIHTADWHWSEERLEKCRQSAAFIIRQMETLQPDVHVIAGDYWDRRQVLASSSAVLPAVEAMKQMAALSPVIMVLGNYSHDAPGSLEIFKSLRTTHPIYTAERPETVLLRTEGAKSSIIERIDPLTIQRGINQDATALFHLLPYPTKSHFLASQTDVSIDEANLLVREALRTIFMGFNAIGKEFHLPRILVAHCTVADAKISSGQTMVGQDIMISQHDLSLAEADYYALGHIHMNQNLAPAMWYSGSIAHTNFGETESKYFNLVELTQGSANVRNVEIPSRPLSLHEVRVDVLSNGLRDQHEECDWINAELRVRVHLTKEQSGLVSDEDIFRKYPGAWSTKIERIIIPEERLRSEDIMTAVALSEKIKEWAMTVNRNVSPEVLEIANEVEQRVRSQQSEDAAP